MLQGKMTEASMQTILIADDNPENLSVLSTMLEGAGYRVRVAKTGIEALSSARSEPPDLLVLDVHMPKMDGYAACQAIKSDSDLRGLPIIFISALSDPFNKKQAFEAGGLDYIEKPFSLEDVINRIRNALHLAWLEKRCAYLESRLKEGSDAKA